MQANFFPEEEFNILSRIAKERLAEDRWKRDSKRFFETGLRALDFFYSRGVKTGFLWVMGADFRARMFTFGVVSLSNSVSEDIVQEIRKLDHELEFCGIPGDVSHAIPTAEARLLRNGRIVAILKLNADSADALWMDEEMPFMGCVEIEAK